MYVQCGCYFLPASTSTKMKNCNADITIINNNNSTASLNFVFRSRCSLSNGSPETSFPHSAMAVEVLQRVISAHLERHFSFIEDETSLAAIPQPAVSCLQDTHGLQLTYPKRRTHTSTRLLTATPHGEQSRVST